MAHVVKWFPEDDKGGEGVFLAGMGDKKIIQVGATLLMLPQRLFILILTCWTAVRHRLWRNYPGIRPAPRGRQHDHLRR